MSELLPCPFCGGPADFGVSRQFSFVNCIECMASTDVLLGDGAKYTKEEAAASWNARSSPEWQPIEPVAWRVRVTKNGKTYNEYTERLPFEPDEDSGVKVRSEPEPLYLRRAEQNASAAEKERT